MKAKRVFHKENILNFRKRMEDRKTDKINTASGTDIMIARCIIYK